MSVIDAEMDPSTRRWLAHIVPDPTGSSCHVSRLTLCGQTCNRQGWLEPRRVIYDHELVIFKTGSYTVDIEGRRHDFSEHSFVIIPPGVWHTTICNEDGVRIYSHFDWSSQVRSEDAPIMTLPPGPIHLESLRPAPDWVPKQILFGQLRQPRIIFDLAERLRLLLSSRQPYEWRVSRGVLLEILLRLLDSDSEQTIDASSVEPIVDQVRLALENPETVYEAGVSIQSTLLQFGYSYEYLSRLFQKRYGCTPLAYQQAIRIERAKNLLRQTELTIEGVAAAVGYSNPAFFFRLFKRHVGETPGRFRQEERTSSHPSG